MTVFYRMCNIPSTNESPILQEDKFKLNELCLKSFVVAFRDVKPKMVFICDYCPETYREMIERVVPFEKEILFTNLGINETCLKQYELAEKVNDVILFQECDYLYRPSVGQQMLDAINEFGLLSPYDHPDFYTRFDIHPTETEVKLFNNAHYRRSRRNTMTFGMTKEVFEDGKKTLNKWGYLDNDVWIELAARGHKLYTPIPGFATHMVKDYLSPAIPWEMLWKILI
jgi:hypothetical protein